jgi:hypothetical protein
VAYNNLTGVLTLTGTASLATYETALESITFSTTSSSTATRTVSYTVNDGANNSAVDTAAVSVVLDEDLDNIVLTRSFPENQRQEVDWLGRGARKETVH